MVRSMSYWTHIDGFISINTYEEPAKRYHDKLKEILGPQDEKDFWTEDGKRIGTLPTGSEGPLRYKIIAAERKIKEWDFKKKKEVPKKVADNIMIWFYGDLRDFGEKDDYYSKSNNTAYIEQWFRKTIDEISKERMWIRYASLEYEANDMEHNILLEVKGGASSRLNEVIRMETLKREGLQTKYV